MTRTLTVAVAFVAAALALAVPAFAATPTTYKGTVGPGFTIKLAPKPTKAGKIRLVVADKSSIHNFHLTGPGVNVKTTVDGTGTKTFTLTLEEGHLPVRLRPARELHEGLLHRFVAFGLAAFGVEGRSAAARTTLVSIQHERCPLPRRAPHARGSGS